MISKSQDLKPPPRKPWLLDNTSSSSLRGMEIGLPPGKRVPPPAVVAAYEVKPLPPVPNRRSGISTFSAEVREAFRTPSGSVICNALDIKLVVQEADIAVVIDTQSDTTGQQAKVDNSSAFTDAPVPDIHPLLPKGSVQQLLQITGAGSAASLALSNSAIHTPSGHNPAQKIKQIMGIDVSPDEPHGYHGHDQEISPLSPESYSSSIYSQDQEEAKPEPEADTYFRHEHLPTPEVTVTSSKYSEPPERWRPPSVAPSAVPESLQIRKAKDRNTFGQDLAPLNEPESPEPTLSNHHHPLDHYHNTIPFRHDLYHATVTELAHKSSSVYSQTSSNGDRHESNFSRPEIWNRPPHQRQDSFSNRPYQSRVRISPPAQLRKPATLSNAAHRFNAPIKTPYPLPRSAFDADDDDEPAHGSASPAGRHSLVAPVFRRTSSNISPTDRSTASPKPTPSPTPRPLNVPPPPRLHERHIRHASLQRQGHSVLSGSTATNHTGPGAQPPPRLHERQIRHHSLQSQGHSVLSGSTATNHTGSGTQPPPRLHEPQIRHHSLQSQGRSVLSGSTATNHTGSGTHRTTGTSYTAPTSRTVTPSPAPHTHIVAIDGAGGKIAYRPAPAVPHRHLTPPPSGAPKQSLASTAAKALGDGVSGLAKRTGELVGQARAGMRSREEKRRDGLKRQIRVLIPGVVELPPDIRRAVAEGREGGVKGEGTRKWV